MTRPSPATLHELLAYAYDDDGRDELRWRWRGVALFNDGKRHSARQLCDNWNGQFAGQIAGDTSSVRNRRIRILTNRYKRRDVIHALIYGEWPAKLNHLNTSGYTGVCWDKNAKRWRAAIKIDGQTKYLGNYHQKSEAIAARAYAVSEHARRRDS